MREQASASPSTHERLGPIVTRAAKAGLLMLLALVAGCRDEAPGVKPPPPDDEPSLCPAVPAAPLRLLTRHEYDNTVRDLVGDLTKPARDFPREPLAQGLDNDATLLQVGPDNVVRYFEAAEGLSQQAVQEGNGTLMPRCEGKAQSACGRDFLQGLAPRVFRRPLLSAEWDVIAGIFDTTLAEEGFAAAIERSLQSLLQSPQFLYRDELGQPAPGGSNLRLSPHQVAAKLSYFLRASTPDASLMAAADAGKLQSSAEVREVATQMMGEAGGMDGLARFLALWLYLDGVELTEKDGDVYPQFDRKLASAWRRSLELYVSDVLATQPTLKALLTSRVLFANDEMSMYDGRGGQGLKPDFVKLETPAGRAGGVLAQPGFLAFKSLHNGSSPIRRGIFVLDKLMCAPPPPPPADQPITPPLPSMTKTTRQRFDAHREDPTCANCHRIIDPVGFLFENYDGMGLWRSHENGIPIDASGGIIDADDPVLAGPIEGVDELVAKLAQSRQVHDCVAREVYRYAVGRPLTDADACWFEGISKKFFESGGNFKELMLAIVSSGSFAQHAALSEAP